MQQYLDIMKDVLENGVQKTDPQGVGNKAVFCREMRFRPAEEFPLLTTKRIPFRFCGTSPVAPDGITYMTTM